MIVHRFHTSRKGTGQMFLSTMFLCIMFLYIVPLHHVASRCSPILCSLALFPCVMPLTLYSLRVASLHHSLHYFFLCTMSLELYFIISCSHMLHSLPLFYVPLPCILLHYISLHNVPFAFPMFPCIMTRQYVPWWHVPWWHVGLCILLHHSYLKFCLASCLEWFQSCHPIF